MSTITSNRSLFVGAFLLVSSGLLFAQARTMSVTVRQAPVREAPSFLAGVVADLSYGASVEILRTERGWVQIRIPGSDAGGWLHVSALTGERLALRSGSNVEQSASNSEVALAGKGFNKQVEEQYKGEKRLDYGWVDKMEKISYPPAKLLAFLEEGHLRGDVAR